MYGTTPGLLRARALRHNRISKTRCRGRSLSARPVAANFAGFSRRASPVIRFPRIITHFAKRINVNVSRIGGAAAYAALSLIRKVPPPPPLSSPSSHCSARRCNPCSKYLILTRESFSFYDRLSFFPALREIYGIDLGVGIWKKRRLIGQLICTTDDLIIGHNNGGHISFLL